MDLHIQFQIFKRSLSSVIRYIYGMFRQYSKYGIHIQSFKYSLCFKKFILFLFDFLSLPYKGPLMKLLKTLVIEGARDINYIKLSKNERHIKNFNSRYN